eukprot:189844-Chlamydomonas_euryale.AAC.1
MADTRLGSFRMRSGKEGAGLPWGRESARALKEATTGRWSEGIPAATRISEALRGARARKAGEA